MSNLLNPNGKFEIFEYQKLGKVRIKLDNQGNPWFCLNDVCEILKIENPHNIICKIDTPYRHSMTVWVQTGVKQDGTPAMNNTPMVFVSEAGLYQGIGRSRKPNVKLFMNWVFGEVLPLLRKTGIYLEDNISVKTKNTPLSLGELITNYENEINSLRKEVETLENKIKSFKDYTREKDRIIDELEESIEKYESIDYDEE